MCLVVYMCVCLFFFYYEYLNSIIVKIYFESVESIDTFVLWETLLLKPFFGIICDPSLLRAKVNIFISFFGFFACLANQVRCNYNRLN